MSTRDKFYTEEIPIEDRTYVLERNFSLGSSICSVGKYLRDSVSYRIFRQDKFRRPNSESVNFSLSGEYIEGYGYKVVIEIIFSNEMVMNECNHEMWHKNVEETLDAVEELGDYLPEIVELLVQV